MVWYASDDERLSFHKTRLIRLIDAMTAAAAQEGSAITGIWLIGMTASAGSETTSAPPDTRSETGFVRGQLQPATD